MPTPARRGATTTKMKTTDIKINRIKVRGLRGASILRSTDRGRKTLETLTKFWFTPGGAMGLDFAGLNALADVVKAASKGHITGTVDANL